MSRPADWEARESGRDLRQSCIVQAPAGSGKTELLTQRMLGLLARVENPEEVVAITFTRKAAAEMSHRLVRQLQAAAANEDISVLKDHELISRNLALAVLDNDSKQGWNLLEQPSRLRIRTIDSLCSELARQLPVLSGLGTGQQVAVDAKALYRQAAARTMAVIEDGSDDLQTDVIRVLNRYDNRYDRLVDLLTGMLANREQWIPYLVDLHTDDGFDRKRLEEALHFLVEIQLRKAKELTPRALLSDLPRFYQYALGNGTVKETELRSMLEVCGGIECDFLDLPASTDALPHWKTMINSLLTKAGEMRKSAPNAREGFPAPSQARGEESARLGAWKDDFKALLDEYRSDDKLREIYKIVLTLPSPAYEDEAWESLESLMRILLRAALEWNVIMAEAGEVDFSEIASRAIQSLGKENAPSDLALRMDYRIRHLLVDEFQDTSHSQVQLLEQLTSGWSDGDGRTLFLVGDPMQSIYRFRKAEVSLFIKAWLGLLFQQIRLVPLQLSVNFRSTRPIVNWVNQAFPSVMPQDNDPVMGAVSYSPASTKPDVSNDGTVAVEILPERDDEEEARQVAEVVGQCDPDETVAILVRSRNHASEILAEFDRRKQANTRFRYQAINFTQLADTTLVRDLVSLTLALLQPADRLAWLATLRAPFIGLDLADLDHLVAGNSGEIILDAIAANTDLGGQGDLSANGMDRLRRTGTVLLSAVSRRGRQSARSLVESAWIELGGPACVENPSELDDASTYFNLLDALEAENLPIDRDTLALRMEDLYAEPDTGANGNLQVLTIYAAKGLQFDTVILPGLNRGTRGDESKLLHWFELAGEDKIVMSPMRSTAEKEKQKSGDLIQFISSIEKQRQILENGRLLYVATTRAVRKLFLFAGVKPNAKNEIKASAGSLLGGLWPAICREQIPLIERAARQAQEAAAQYEEEGAAMGDEDTVPVPGLPRDYRRLDADWQLPVPPGTVQLNKTEHGEVQDYIEFSWAGEGARLTGDLVHRILQMIGEQGIETWQAGDGLSRMGSWCRQQLAAEGVRDEKADTIIGRVSAAIKNSLASEQGRWILDSHQDAHCEYAITAVLDKMKEDGTGNSQARNLVLDRTFIDAGTRWIIDYKSSSHGGGDLEGFLENEAERYRTQLQRYKKALAISETLPIKTALYFPLLDRFVEVD